MSNIALILGPIVFKDFEVPAGINFGGLQRIAVHDLLGGTRIIDTMGRADSTLQFSGIFSGSDATIRVRALNEMRAAGIMLPLTWDVFFYTVVISDFSATYENPSWISYKLTCTVLRDEASVIIQDAVSLGADVLADVATAAAQASLAGSDLSASQSALSVAGATTRGTAAFTAAQTAVSADQGSLLASISSSESSLSGLASVSPAAGTGIAASGISQIDAAINAAQSASLLTTANSYLGRIAANISNAST